MNGALAVEGLVVRFGGLVAVDGLSLTAPFGAITGLIGPNGAGKSTTFDACSGLVRPAAGTITFDGRDIAHLSVAARSRLGLGRTFQRMSLFDSASVATNVSLGCEGAFAGRSPLRQVWATGAERRAVAEATARALAACALEELAGSAVRELSSGQRRLVELARVLAGRHRLLLLDEPSSGLDSEETANFAAVLSGAVRATGAGVLLVEHDMDLVQDICETVHVIEFGRLIFSGTPRAAQRSPKVRAAYLGTGGAA